MEEPSRKEFGKLASRELYRTLKSAGAFEFPKLPSDISIDTTNQSPTVTAKQISDQLAS